jgi:hypothetical protein
MPQRINSKVTGLERVIDLEELLLKSARYVKGMRARIVNDKPYTHWIEEGYYLNGRPGRRKAGPARMMRKGLQRVRELIRPSVARNLEKGPVAVQHGVSGVLAEGTRVTKSNTPVRTGNLRNAFHTVGPERG